MNRLVKVAVALGVLGAVAGATIGAVRLNAPHGETVHVAEVRTAVVERGALAAGMRLTGTLTHGQLTPLSGSVEGVLTALPAPGAQVSAGRALALKASVVALGHDVGDDPYPAADAPTAITRPTPWIAKSPFTRTSDAESQPFRLPRVIAPIESGPAPDGNATIRPRTDVVCLHLIRFERC